MHVIVNGESSACDRARRFANFGEFTFLEENKRKEDELIDGDKQSNTMGPLSDMNMITGEGETIKVEHILVFGLSGALDKALKAATAAWGRSCKNSFDTVRVVGYGLAAYLVLMGTSSFIDAVRGYRRDKWQRDEELRELKLMRGRLQDILSETGNSSSSSSSSSAPSEEIESNPEDTAFRDRINVKTPEMVSKSTVALITPSPESEATATAPSSSVVPPTEKEPLAPSLKAVPSTKSGVTAPSFEVVPPTEREALATPAPEVVPATKRESTAPLSRVVPATKSEATAPSPEVVPATKNEATASLFDVAVSLAASSSIAPLVDKHKDELSWLFQCTFETDRLMVAPLDHKDDPSFSTVVAAICNILTEDTTAHLPSEWQGDYDTTRAQTWIQEAVQPNSPVLLVRETETNDIIGLLILRVYDEEQGDGESRSSQKAEPRVTRIMVGYVLAKESTGQGFESELIKGFCQWCSGQPKSRPILLGAGVASSTTQHPTESWKKPGLFWFVMRKEMQL
jgi:hypothetical protein